MTKLPPPGGRVAIYSRSATITQDLDAMAPQERRCGEYSQHQHWAETGRYSDVARSGTTTAGRAGLFAMMVAANRGEFDVLLVEDLDRLSRSATYPPAALMELKELNVTICTAANTVVTGAQLAMEASLVTRDGTRKVYGERRETSPQ